MTRRKKKARFRRALVSFWVNQYHFMLLRLLKWLEEVLWWGSPQLQSAVENFLDVIYQRSKYLGDALGSGECSAFQIMFVRRVEQKRRGSSDPTAHFV